MTASFFDQVWGMAATVVGDFAPAIAFVAGLGVAFLVIDFVVNLVMRRIRQRGGDNV